MLQGVFNNFPCRKKTNSHIEEETWWNTCYATSIIHYISRLVICPSVFSNIHVTTDSPTICNITLRGNQHSHSSDFSPLDKPLCDQCVTSLKHFSADEHTHRVLLFKCSFTRLKNWISLLVLHVASDHFLNILERARYVFMFVLLHVRIVPRGLSDAPYSLQSFTLCVRGCVSWCHILRRISSESGASSSNTCFFPYVCECMQSVHAQTITKPVQLSHAHTHTLQLFPFSSEEILTIILCVILPVMPIHTGASVGCPAGVLPRTHIKAIIERLASRQPGFSVYMCLLHTVMWDWMIPCERPP